MWIMCGQPPSFTEEDNPASFSPSLLTRVLTLNHLLFVNVWLLLCPRVLSYDWQVGSIPLVTHLADVRNVATVCVHLFLLSAGRVCLRPFLTQYTTNETHQHKNNVTNNDNNNNSAIPTTTGTTTITTSTNSSSSSSSSNSSNNSNNNSTNSSSNNSSSSKKSVSRSVPQAGPGAGLGVEVPPVPVVLVVGMALVTLPFLPSSNLFFRVGFVVAERVLYIPRLMPACSGAVVWCWCGVAVAVVLLWCCCGVAVGVMSCGVAVGVGGLNLWRCGPVTGSGPWRGCLILWATALCLMMAATTLHRNPVWTSRESLFRSGVQTLPHNAKMHYNYANYLKDSGLPTQAEHHYRTAIRLYSRQPSYHNNLGTVVRDGAEAERCYRAALLLLPHHRGALVNLGNLLLSRNNSTGEDLLHQALARDPVYMDALLSLAQLDIKRGRWRQAEETIQTALRTRPHLPDLHHHYGIVLHHTGRYEAAVDRYNRAITLDSTFVPAMTSAAASLRQLGRQDQAEALLKRGGHYTGEGTIHRGRYCTQGRALYTGEGTVHRGGHCTQGRALYTGEGTVQRGEHCTQGRALYTGEGMGYMGGHCTQGRALYTGEGTVHRGGHCTQGRALYTGEGIVHRGGHFTQGRALYTG
ncbi:hypothetical protein ACOMHN_060573 [Nucella lapillus]